jgi:glycosyltransferase involved in cell wall biosynthesis
VVVFINGRFLTQPLTGVQRYAFEIVKALDKLLDQGVINKDEFSFVLISPKKFEPKIKLNNILLKQVGISRGYFWEQAVLPFFVGKALLINLCNTAPLIKKNNVVTIHDAGVFATPEAYTFLFRKWYRALFLWLRFRSLQFVTVSRFSCEEFIKYCKIAENKIHVIYEGAEHILASPPDNTILRKYELVDKGYLLVVGSLTPNKNFNLV